MKYIVVALKPEAQAIVEKFKLKKSKVDSYTLFTNDEIKLIISGIGIENARLATQTLINYFDICDEDVYINIGICGASHSYAIGELIECGGVFYDGLEYSIDTQKPLICCVREAVSDDGEKDLVDMESYGFFDAVMHNPAIKEFHIYKVVSDHFEPEKVTKEQTKELMADALKGANSVI